MAKKISVLDMHEHHNKNKGDPHPELKDQFQIVLAEDDNGMVLDGLVLSRSLLQQLVAKAQEALKNK